MEAKQDHRALTLPWGVREVLGERWHVHEEMEDRREEFNTTTSSEKRIFVVRGECKDRWLTSCKVPVPSVACSKLPEY
jgi:hypothetical protein